MVDKIGRTKVTSQDCVLPEMAGKYDLVFYASQRARSIVNGSPALVSGFESPKNHSIIVALEEIRQGKLTFQDLMESLTSPFVEEETEEPFASLDLRNSSNDEEGEEGEEELEDDQVEEEEHEDESEDEEELE